MKDRSSEEVLLSEVRYRRLFESARDGILILDAETGDIIEVNPFLEELLGFSREQFLGKKVWEIGPFKDVFASQEKFLELQRVGFVRYDDLPLQTSAGRKVQVEFVSNVYLEGPSRVIQCNIRDNTVRLHADEALRQSEMLSRSLVDHLPQRIFVKDRNSTYLFCNSNYALDLGIGPSEIIGKDDSAFFPPGLAEAYRADDRAVMTEGKIKDIVERYEAAGKQRWAHTVKVPYRDGHGEIIGVVGLFEDITERRNQEVAAAESADRVNLLMDSTAEGIYGVDLEGKCVWVNKSCLALLGYGHADELLGRSMHDVMHHSRADGTSLPESSCPIYQAFRESRPIHIPEEVFWRKDRTEIPVEVWSYPVSKDGRVIGAVATFIDITERKQAGAALRQSESAYRELFEASADGIVITDDETRMFRYVNRAICRMLGYSQEELKLLGVGGIHPKEVLPTIAAAMRAQSVGENTHAVELPCLKKDGTIIQADISAAALTVDERPCHVAMFRDITERKRAEVELERLKTAIEQTGESLFITDLEGTIQFVNPAFVALTGFSREEAVGSNPRILKSGVHDEKFYRKMWETISSGRVWKGRLVDKRKDGSLRTEDTTISPLRDPSGRIINYVAIKRDVTEEIRLEGELRQSQKMESVGRLAGGVAHDFNNILTAISGYTGFALAGLPEGAQRRADLQEVLSACERATRLTRQLLAFSRRQILRPEVLDLNAAVGGMMNMLKRLIGEDVELQTRLAAQACLVLVDSGQIEQVFLNLAVNARDAMPKGGTLIFETATAPATEDFLARHPDMPHGPLVCLSVRDTGCGMSDAVKAHLFEPFFTTKEKGKGTGLGLSMVYGIIKQSGGDVEVESAPDRGTTFRIYFPQIDERTRKQDKKKEEDVVARGNETVLLVEDEGPIRIIGERALSANGYAVLVAAGGREALEVLKRHGRPVDLLITDVVMPGMSGRELAKEIASLNMVRRVLFISGFTDDAIVKHGVLEPGLAFMYKPFSPDALLRKMREVLDGPADLAKA